MRFLMTLALALVLGAAPPALADGLVFDDFKQRPETRWRFFSDQVMGGVSTGLVSIQQEKSQPFARMTGRVSTANNGGFIQMRLDLPKPPEGVRGVRLVVRGNGQRYFVHLRTRGMLLPSQYYQAGFEAPGDWTEVRLQLADFSASGAFLRAQPRAGTLTSIAIVAFGRDHDARIDVRMIGFY